jgi:hypothetical protein
MLYVSVASTTAVIRTYLHVSKMEVRGKMIDEERFSPCALSTGDPTGDVPAFPFGPPGREDKPEADPDPDEEEPERRGTGPFDPTTPSPDDHAPVPAEPAPDGPPPGGGDGGETWDPDITPDPADPRRWQLVPV